MKKKNLSNKERENLAIDFIGKAFALAVGLVGFYYLIVIVTALFKIYETL